MSDKVTHIAEGLRRRWKRKGYDPTRHDYDGGVEKAKATLADRVTNAGRRAMKVRHEAAGTCDPADVILVRRKHQDWIECPGCGWGVDARFHAQWSPDHYAAIVAARGTPDMWPKRWPRTRP